MGLENIRLVVTERVGWVCQHDRARKTGNGPLGIVTPLSFWLERMQGGQLGISFSGREAVFPISCGRPKKVSIWVEGKIGRKLQQSRHARCQGGKVS